ncbi:MAG: hypothetical protein CMO74_15085 [Verrucomicrobiales bacterium]|nr:hypothetical protein [Verrucomicrobiales bacterium]|tara:strand:+ start:978 stop:2456 length:1479 start_codon:yes stop_codon:yes gene_type:complete
MKPTRFIFASLVLAAFVQAAPSRLPAGYAVDTVDIPKEITLGVGGMAFLDETTLLICTREGEVWKFNTGNGKWSLFADGLHESLGLWVNPKNKVVYVMQRPELTKLVDSNKDGVADQYQTVNAGWGLTDNYHEYSFGPVRDSKGNFYGTLNTSLSWPGWAGSAKWDKARVHDSKMGRAAKYRGWSFQITPDGKFVPFSLGMRSPAGIGISKDDDIFYTDNQGDWNETSTLHHVVKDRFHGHPSSYYDHPKYIGKDLNKISIEEYRKMRARPAVFIPHGELANSPGEPVFDYTGGKFGPFNGQIILGDQTKSNLMRLHVEKVGGEFQGMAINFISPLQTGCIRGVFGPDGSFWVGQTGRGWGSVGGKQFGLQRVRWDGKTTPMAIHHISLTKTGFDVHFTLPVDAAAGVDVANYDILEYEYRYRPQYGSPKEKQKKMKPTAVKLSADRKVAHLTVPLNAEKIYQFNLNQNLRATSGAEIVNRVAWYTANRLHK